MSQSSAHMGSHIKPNSTTFPPCYMPPELIYSQEERNNRLQLQNFKIYNELRYKMELSI